MNWIFCISAKIQFMLREEARCHPIVQKRSPQSRFQEHVLLAGLSPQRHAGLPSICMQGAFTSLLGRALLSVAFASRCPGVAPRTNRSASGNLLFDCDRRRRFRRRCPSLRCSSRVGHGHSCVVPMCWSSKVGAGRVVASQPASPAYYQHAGARISLMICQLYCLFKLSRMGRCFIAFGCCSPEQRGSVAA